jgi:hypothetical protein
MFQFTWKGYTGYDRSAMERLGQLPRVDQIGKENARTFLFEGLMGATLGK